MIINI